MQSCTMIFFLWTGTFLSTHLYTGVNQPVFPVQMLIYMWSSTVAVLNHVAGIKIVQFIFCVFLHQPSAVFTYLYIVSHVIITIFNYDSANCMFS